MTWRASALKFALVFVALLAAASPAHASVFLFQWVDNEAVGLRGDTYKDGVLIQSIVVSDEDYSNGYGLWDGAVMSHDVSVAANIYEPDGVTLSDTWQIFGRQGDQVINIPFHSDHEGSVLAPLAGATKMIENGGFQTLTAFDVSNGDQYTWQFASDVEAVPEPASLLLLGSGLIAVLRLRRKKA